MNKKKRALSLGLAAVQLAAFAPAYSQVAFAANPVTVSTVAASDTTNVTATKESNGISIEADFSKISVLTGNDAYGGRAFELKLTLNGITWSDYSNYYDATKAQTVLGYQIGEAPSGEASGETAEGVLTAGGVHPNRGEFTQDSSNVSFSLWMNENWLADDGTAAKYYVRVVAVKTTDDGKIDKNTTDTGFTNGVKVLSDNLTITVKDKGEYVLADNATKPANCKLSYKKDNAVLGNTDKVKVGDTVTILCEPEEGYEIKEAPSIGSGDNKQVFTDSDTDGVWELETTVPAPDYTEATISDIKMPAVTATATLAPVEVTAAVDTNVTLDAVTGEDEAAVIAAAKEKITAQLADETTPLLEFKETASGNTPVDLTYNTDYQVTFDEGAFSDSNTDSVKDTVTFNLTVKLTADGLKKVNFGDKTAPGTGKEDTKTVEVTVAGKAVSPVSWKTETASFTGSENATITVKKGSTELAAADKVKEGDVLTVEVAAKEGFHFKTAPTATASKTGSATDTLTFTKDATSEMYSATVTVGAQTADTDFTIAFTAGEVEAIPTATITTVTTGLTGVANATVELFKSDGTTELGTTALKNGEKFKVKVTPKTGYEILTAPNYQLGSGAQTALTKNGDAYEAEIEITGLSTAGNTELTLTLTGEVTKKPVVAVTEVVKGVENAAGMNGTYGNYNDNLDKYTPTLTTDSDGNYVITVDTQYGAMKGTAAAGGNGKNVLLLLKMQENIDTKVFQENGGSWTEVTDAAGNASTFLVDADHSGDADQTTLYKPLWVSLTDARLADGFEGVKFKLVSGNASKIVTVKFTDTTEYSVTGNLSETDYTASATVSADKKTATITVSPADGKILTAASIKLGDNTTVALKPDGKNYTGEVEIKKLLTSTEIENGTVTKTLAAGDFTVTASAPSTILVNTVSLPTKLSGTLSGTTLTNYQHNNGLIEGKVTWDSANNITTVEVPSALLKGTDTTSPGSGAANICLLMKFQNKLAKDDTQASNKWGVNSGKIQDVDIEDGWQFAEGATVDDKGLYAVLWINASEQALDDQGGNKVVIYDDKDGSVITTVSLVKVEAIKPSEVNTGISAVSLTAGDTEAEKKADIVAAVETKLGADKAALVDIEVTGTIPAEGDAAQNGVNVEVTITAKSGAKVVLADADDKAAASIVFNVPVDVPAVTKYTVTVPAATADGSVTADNANAAAGKKVTLTVTPTSGKELGTLTIKDASNNVIEYTEEADGTYTFTMPASNVTVSATFVDETVETEIEASDISITAALTGLTVGSNVPAITVGASDKFTAATAVTNAGGTAVTGKFTATGTYTAKVTLTPKTGYKFGTNAPAVTGWTESKSGNNAVYTKTFEVAAAPDTPDTPDAPKAQKAPAAPTMRRRANTSITLNAISANANGAAAEYSKDGKTWQSSPTFTGLTRNTAYTFYARYAAVEGFAASPASAGTEIKTTNTSSSGGSSGGGSSSGGSSWHPSSGGSSTSSGSSPADSSSTTTPNITNDTADDINDVIKTTATAGNLSKITDSAEDVEKALKNISKPSVVEKQAATVLDAAIKEAKAAVTAADKAACAENIQLVMKALNTKAPKVRGDADNSGKVDSQDVLTSVLNFRKYRTNAAGQLFTAVTMGVTEKTSINTNDILAFIKAFRTR